MYQKMGPDSVIIYFIFFLTKKQCHNEFQAVTTSISGTVNVLFVGFRRQRLKLLVLAIVATTEGAHSSTGE
jgi:hypothetical protein